MQEIIIKKTMGKNLINVALFGLGRIGLMHADNLINNKNFNLKYIFDVNRKLSKKFSRVKFGHPEGYLDAFANIYKEFAEYLKTNTKKRFYFPNEEEGLETAKFIDACKKSSLKKQWVKI